MIIIKLNGGLGNQLFEYACARNLQLKYNDSLYLDIEGFKHSPRHYALENFVKHESVKVLPEKDSKNLVFLQAVSKMSRELAFKLGPLFGSYVWKTAKYKPLNIQDTKSRKLYLYGYWQCEEYFKEEALKIKQELRVKTNIPAICSDLMNEINKPNSVCVHIRRGDYVTCGFLSCDETYYNKGMDYIFDKHQNSNYIIFSDDIEWVKKNMKFNHEVTYVDVDVSDCETLRLMYMCKHFVMSNSSFSWWAQYLSENEEKIVIAPSVWYPKGQGDGSIYLKSWVII